MRLKVPRHCLLGFNTKGDLSTSITFSPQLLESDTDSFMVRGEHASRSWGGEAFSASEEVIRSIKTMRLETLA